MSGIGGALVVSLVDMGVVFFVLSVVAFMMYLLGKSVSAWERIVAGGDPAAAGGAGPRSADAEAGRGGDGGEAASGAPLPVLAAAVAACLGHGSFRFRSVRRYDEELGEWVLSGRGHGGSPGGRGCGR